MATSGVIGRQQMRRDMMEWLNEMDGDVVKDTAEAALKAAIAGEESVRQTIDTTPSSMSNTPKGHRNWTGHMRSRVDSNVKHRGNEITIEVGWFNMRADEIYFRIQEDGGHVHGRTIVAMNALGKSVIAMERILRREGIT